MDSEKRNSFEALKSSGPKEFKTMEIQTKPGSNQQFNSFYQQPQFYYNMYTPLVMIIQSFMQNESNKKFYKNEVLNIKMTQLHNYEDIKKIKSFFPSCSTLNNWMLNFQTLHKAEFFILRSTCDDDIHKVSWLGHKIRDLDIDELHESRVKQQI